VESLLCATRLSTRYSEHNPVIIAIDNIVTQTVLLILTHSIECHSSGQVHSTECHSSGQVELKGLT